ncbi:MAG: M15 family metallopeptidase [Clostridiales bacterium]|nr:M15 family metallopeptidase [Clostridiales bacterium]
MNRRSIRKRRRSRRRNFARGLTVAAVCLVVFTVGMAAPREVSAKAPDMSARAMDTADIKDTHHLELVNGNNPVVGGGVDTRRLAAVGEGGVMLHEDALLAISRLFVAAEKAGIGSLYVLSGHRDESKQAQLYETAADKSFVQPPGHSEHHTGLAADILPVGVGMHEMDGTPEAVWLAENAWRYGLILRYAESKRDITKIAYEPWHFRYVGQPHAAYMHENGLCLEEYIEFLQDVGGYKAEFHGKSYTVLYERPKNGVIKVPESKDYTISGNNMGGYIVTAWERN